MTITAETLGHVADWFGETEGPEDVGLPLEALREFVEEHTFDGMHAPELPGDAALVCGLVMGMKLGQDMVRHELENHDG